jgi:beta-ureidopropionase
MAVSNALFIGANNRVGFEPPWSTGEYYGTSYFCNPKGEIIAQGSQDRDELVVADLNLDMIRQAREERPLYRDLRPEMYYVPHASF